MYDKVVTAPRMIAWYGATSRVERKSNPDWPHQLLEIRARVQQHTNIKFNAVLLNLYRDGSDGVGWHSDKTTSSNKNMNIASVTFGETRLFRLRHKTLKHIPQ
ncbi:alpha-ketoglutarate-dependent dioxygenase AlkB, partial [Flavobacterium circumlabens]